MRAFLPIGLVASLAILTTCVGCSTSTLVQVSEIAPLASSMLDYHDANAERLLDASQIDQALVESAALRWAMDSQEISQEALASLLVPVLDRYGVMVEADPELLDSWRARRLRDIPILRRVAGLSGG